MNIDGLTLAFIDVIVPRPIHCVVKILDNWSLDRSVSMTQFKLIIRLRKMVHGRLHS